MERLNKILVNVLQVSMELSGLKYYARISSQVSSLKILSQRSSRPGVAYQISALWSISQNSNENTCVGVSFLIKKVFFPLLKRRSWRWCFHVNFEKLFRTPFFEEHLAWLLLQSLWLCLQCSDILGSLVFLDLIVTMHVSSPYPKSSVKALTLPTQHISESFIKIKIKFLFSHVSSCLKRFYESL